MSDRIRLRIEDIVCHDSRIIRDNSMTIDLRVLFDVIGFLTIFSHFSTRCLQIVSLQTLHFTCSFDVFLNARLRNRSSSDESVCVVDMSFLWYRGHIQVYEKIKDKSFNCKNSVLTTNDIKNTETMKMTDPILFLSVMRFQRFLDTDLSYRDTRRHEKHVYVEYFGFP